MNKPFSDSPFQDHGDISTLKHTNPTTLQEDEELDVIEKALADSFKNYLITIPGAYGSLGQTDTTFLLAAKHFTNQYARFFESHSEQKALEARIDEHYHIAEMKPLTTVDPLINLWNGRMDERLAQLTNKQEEKE